MRKMLAIGPKAGAAIAEFSNQFQKEFLMLLKSSHQTNRVRANAVYNEYIQDKHHVHMNATRWVSLNGFVMTMGKAGIVKVDEDEKGLWITWVDNSPKTLQRQVGWIFPKAVLVADHRPRRRKRTGHRWTEKRGNEPSWTLKSLGRKH